MPFATVPALIAEVLERPMTLRRGKRLILVGWRGPVPPDIQYGEPALFAQIIPPNSRRTRIGVMIPLSSAEELYRREHRLAAETVSDFDQGATSLKWFQGVFERVSYLLCELFSGTAMPGMVSTRIIKRPAEMTFLKSVFRKEGNVQAYHFLFRCSDSGSQFEVVFFLPDRAARIFEAMEEDSDLFSAMREKYLEMSDDNLPNYPVSKRWTMDLPDFGVFARLIAGTAAESDLSDHFACPTTLNILQVVAAPAIDLLEECFKDASVLLGSVTLGDKVPIHVPVFTHGRWRHTSASALLPALAKGVKDGLLIQTGEVKPVAHKVAPTFKWKGREMLKRNERRSKTAAAPGSDPGGSVGSMPVECAVRFVIELREGHDRAERFSILFSTQGLNAMLSCFFSDRTLDIRATPENIFLSLIDLNWAVAREAMLFPEAARGFMGEEWSAAFDYEPDLGLWEGRLPGASDFLCPEDLLEAPARARRKIIDAWVARGAGRDWFDHFLRACRPPLRRAFFSAMTGEQRSEFKHRLSMLPESIPVEVSAYSIVAFLAFVEDLVREGFLDEPGRWLLRVQQFDAHDRRNRARMAREFLSVGYLAKAVAAIGRKDTARRLRRVEDDTLLAALGDPDPSLSTALLSCLSRGRAMRLRESLKGSTRSIEDVVAAQKRLLAVFAEGLGESDVETLVVSAGNRAMRLGYCGHNGEIVGELGWCDDLCVNRGRPHPIIQCWLAWIYLIEKGDIHRAERLTVDAISWMNSRSPIEFCSNYLAPILKENVPEIAAACQNPSTAPYYHKHYIAMAYDTLGWCAFKRRDYRRSIRLLGKAIDILPSGSESTINYQVVLGHLRIAEREAKSRWGGRPPALFAAGQNPGIIL